ncbi:FMN reductase [Rhodococcus sp. WMMA185]|uniref:NAD(P)H-dependent oxidoreductase n=1 Tax=Rhodococcus sp. WMMA185 TaxID=679318 RepID=UPI00087896C8|nr:NAD(P)H-dependent oxidoreductase [Rhodococcus sp. WMMA185]AOW92289.1 FMN reductase [Rhodococcus sp. WMMA185]
MSQTTVLALVGSLRAASVNRQVAETAVSVAPEGVEVIIFDGLGDVPFYNEDIDGAAPIPAVEALREAAGRADALLLVTPEYNGTVPAVLKNAIDWISRPYGSGAVQGKPVAVISASPSVNGGRWAHEDTRKTARIAGGNVLEDVTLAIGRTGEKFADGHPKENLEVAEQVAGVVISLADATRQLVDA